MKSPYPTAAEIEEIKTLNPFETRLAGAVDVIRGVWSDDYGKLLFDGTTLTLATGGWSGNEEIVEALQDNESFWNLYWRETHRGGGYIFRNGTT